MIQAQRHQGHESFQGRGRQCVANSAAAILKSADLPPKNWTSSTLDDILVVGDKLYMNIIDKNPEITYLTVDNLPKHLFTIGNSATGALNSTPDKPYYSLQDAADTVLGLEDKVYTIFTMGNSSPCYSCCIIKSSGVFYFFDPHSRSYTGMQSPEGFATLTAHQSSSSMCLFIRHLAASLNLKGSVPFEFVRMQVNNALFTDESDTDSESDFSGFDSLSEGDVACRLYLAEEHVQSAMASSFSEDNESVYSMNSNEICEVVEGLNDSSSFIASIVTDIFDDFAVDDKIEQNDKTSMRNIEGSQNEFETLRNTNADENSSIDERGDFNTDGEVEQNIMNNQNYNTNEGTIDRVTNICINSPNDYSNSAETDSHKENNYYNKASLNKESDQESDTYCDSDTEEYLPSSSDSSGENNSLPLEFLRQKIKRNQLIKKRSHSRKEGITVTQETMIDIEKRMSNKDHTNTCSHQQISETQRGRKRIRDDQKWKAKTAKRRRNEGKSYVNKHGCIKPAKKLKQPCGCKCRFRCTAKVTEEEREKIFHSFWKLGNLAKQRQFIMKYTIKKEKKRNKTFVSRRSNSFIWTLPRLSSGETIRVCKVFFLNTLSVSDQFVTTAHNKSFVGVVENEKRGTNKASRHNKTSPSKLNDVREHIQGFPTVESHYCRKDSSCKYLSPDLSIKEMYRLYKTDCLTNNKAYVSEYIYRHIFVTEFNLRFHTPKKDQCDLCSIFKNSSPEEKLILKDDYEIHIQNKNLSFLNKDNDKESAKIDPELTVSCFDLEQVLMTPKAFESCIYYKRQLNNYNFTVYDLGTHQGYNFLWNETVASRGGCEIASCVYHFIRSKVAEGKKKFVFFSDNCVPQNKNKFYLSMLWYCVQKFDLQYIEHKYFEKGHTRNENDSMHAAIERAGKKIPVYTTSQWATVIQSARKSLPYHVKEMSLSDFYNFREIAEMFLNFDTDDDNNKVSWNSMRTIKVSAEMPHSFSFLYNYNGQTKYVNLLSRQLRRTQHCISINPKTHVLTWLRKELIPLSTEKYNDLIKLCLDDIIPKPHHLFYALLPHEINI